MVSRIKEQGRVSVMDEQGQAARLTMPFPHEAGAIIERAGEMAGAGRGQQPVHRSEDAQLLALLFDALLIGLTLLLKLLSLLRTLRNQAVMAFRQSER